VTQKIKVILFQLQFCTLQEPKLPLQIFKIAVMFDWKKNSINYS